MVENMDVVDDVSLCAFERTMSSPIMSPPFLLVRDGVQNGSPSQQAVDASPTVATLSRSGNYSFRLHDTPIVQPELQMGDLIPKQSRHGNAELFEQIDAGWTDRIPPAVSSDTTPRLSPRVSMQQTRSSLILPAADQTEEETDATMGPAPNCFECKFACARLIALYCACTNI